MGISIAVDTESTIRGYGDFRDEHHRDRPRCSMDSKIEVRYDRV